MLIACSIYLAAEKLVLPPGYRPYGPEAGPGQSQKALPKSKAMGYWNIGVLEYWRFFRIEILFHMNDTD
jgi:hypothetical protein